MKTKFKKALSLALAFVLILGLVPIGTVAQAEDTLDLEPQATSPVQETEAETAALAADTEPESIDPVQETAAATENEATEETAAATASETTAENEATEETTTLPAESSTEETETPEAEKVQGPQKAPRAANYLNVWGSYVINQDTQYWFGNTFCWGLERLDLDGTAAYCIEPSIRTTSQTYSRYTTEYARNKLGQAKYLAISLALAYGWPNTSYANQNSGYSMLLSNSATWQETEKWAATQTIVWEFALGYRDTSWPYSCNNPVLYNRYHTAAWGNTWDTYAYVYRQIEQKLAKHNQIPSFCSSGPGQAPTHKMTYDKASGNYKLTLTDTKGILSNYSVSTTLSGVTFSQSGNTLTITVTPAAAQQLQGGVSCRLQSSSILDIDPDRVVAMWGKPSQQTVVTPVYGQVDPARAYFKLEAGTNIAKVVKQNSEAGGRIANFTFELRDSAGTVLDTKVTDANGNLAFSTALTVGATYVIHEVPTEGYIPQRDQYITAKEGDNVVTFVNTKVYGNVQVVKVDAETGDRLTGAVFQIYQDSNGDGVLDDVDLPSAATMKTDGENPGVYDFNHLPYGKYHLREVQAPEGYYLDDTIYNFEIVEDGKTVIVESATGTGTIANEPMIPEIGTTATVDGSHKIYGTEIFTLKDVVAYKNLIPGKTYTVSGVLMDKATGEPLLIDGEEVTSKTTFVPEESSGTVTVSFQFDSRKIKTETEIVVFESLLLNSKEVAVHANINDQGQTVKVTLPEIGTTAMVDGSHEIYGTEVFTLEDVVAYKNLTPGKEYTLSGVLMDKATGSPLLIDGEEVTAETTFVPEESSGTVTVSFQFDSRKIKTETEIVAFESLERDGVEIAVHADLEDGGQTVTVYVPEIGTTATIDGKKDVLAGKTVIITDVVAYSNLTPGRKYTVKGVLMNKATGKAFLVNGKEVTAEVTFTPDVKDGQVTVQFVFDASGITRSTKLVVFENVYHEDVEIAVHADINDEGQTVTITPPQTPPNTGDSSNLVLWGSLLTLTLMALAGIAVLTLRKKN